MISSPGGAFLDLTSGLNKVVRWDVRAPDDERFSFDKFAAHPFFKEVNEWLVARAGITPGSDVVDLGCGPGAVTELILTWMGVPPQGRVFAIDPSPSALVHAAERVQSAKRPDWA